MPTLDEIPEGTDPVHLLAIGDSKAGKSVYAAQAALDGFNVIYIDGDNGASALRWTLRDKPEARRRVHYLGVTKIATFLQNFLRSTTTRPMLWRPKANLLYSKLLGGLDPDEPVWILDITKVPASWLLVVDSWTAAAMEALGIGSPDQLAKLLEGTDQGIYGSASSQLTYICNMLQKIPQHLIVQAHGTQFEIYEKPTGKTQKEMKQGEMVLRDTIGVPVSSSRAHGQTMVSRFNHIGWITVTRLGESEIDFTRTNIRVGGGPPNRKEKVNVLTFTKLVGGVPEHEDGTGWLIETTHGKILEEDERRKAEAAAAKPAATITMAATPATGLQPKLAVTVPPAGTKIMLGGGLKK